MKSINNEKVIDFGGSKDLFKLIGRINIVELFYCYSTESKLQKICNLHENPYFFFREIEKSIEKFILKPKRHTIGKAILSINNNPEGITVTDLKLH
jgi:hypothetical protein